MILGLQKSADLARKTATSRDGRIDFFRGVALLCIFVDHIPGNVISRLTLHNLGFSDAAELFVLLAGVSSALAYSRRADANILIIKRVARIYLSHIALVLMIVAILALAAVCSGNPDLTGHATLAPFLADPLPALRRTVLLAHQPEFIDILPLYLVLLLWLTALLHLARKSTVLALGISVSMWLAAWLFEINLPGDRNGGWFFDPFAWQLVYSIGVIIGLRKSKGGEGKELPKSRAVLFAAIAFLAFAFVLREPWAQFPIAGLRAFHILPADLIGLPSKTYASGWRVAHVLCLAYVAAWYVPQSAAWLNDDWALRVRQLGRIPLVMFMLASLFSYVASIGFILYGKGLVVQLLCNAVGLTGLIAFGTSASLIKRGRAVRVSSAQPATQESRSGPLAAVSR